MHADRRHCRHSRQHPPSKPCSTISPARRGRDHQSRRPRFRSAMAARTAERLQALGWPTVRGNHDRRVAPRPAGRNGPSTFAHDRLTQAQRDGWSTSRQATIAPGCCLPRAPDHDGYLLDAIVDGRLRAPLAAIANAPNRSIRLRLLLCGHSHRTELLRMPDGWIFNPGSVGCRPDDPTSRHVSGRDRRMHATASSSLARAALPTGSSDRRRYTTGRGVRAEHSAAGMGAGLRTGFIRRLRRRLQSPSPAARCPALGDACQTALHGDPTPASSSFWDRMSSC